MKPRKKLEEALEDVLCAFAQACPDPKAQDVREWAGEHPECATAILELACSLHLSAPLYDPKAEPTQAQLDEAWRRHRACAVGLVGSGRPAPRIPDLER